MPKHMTEESIAAGLEALAHREGGSGLVRNVGYGMVDNLRGRSQELDGQIAAFEAARKRLEHQVMRGHDGITELDDLALRAVQLRVLIQNAAAPK
jgi:hypothetical protein